MADDFEITARKILFSRLLDIYSHYIRKTLRSGRRRAAGDRSLRDGLPGQGEAQSRNFTRLIVRLAANTPMRRSSRPSGCSRPRAPPASRFSTPLGRHQSGQPAGARHRHQAQARVEKPGALRDQARLQAAARRRRHHQAARERLLRHAAHGASDPARHPDPDRLRRKHLGLRARHRGRRLFNGFHVVLVEECCFDRSVLSHKVNLFDMHHKYADVMHIDEVVAHLDGLAVKKAS